MEVSGSGGGSKLDRSTGAAYHQAQGEVSRDPTTTADKEKEEEESESLGTRESESGSDDGCRSDVNYGSDDDDKEEEDEDVDEVPRIWDPINKDDGDGLMKLLKLPEDGQKDFDYSHLRKAYHWSCHLNKPGCVKALLDCGVDWFAVVDDLLLCAISEDSKDAAQIVINYAKEKKVLDKLLGAGDEPTLTPLHEAALCGSCNVIQLLLDQGADPCKEDTKRKLPCDYGHPGTKARKLLVDAVLNKARRSKNAKLIHMNVCG